MNQTPEYIEVDVEGGKLTVAQWGAGPEIILGIHGITASSMCLAPVARHLDDRSTLLAPDLRGRGASSSLPAPYGMRAHANDCARVLEHFDTGPVTVIGESMGGFVAVVLAADHPHLVASLLLVDGGLPLPQPDGVDPDAILDAILGPALARLSQQFASTDAYLQFWRSHPAFADGWNNDIETYLAYDLTGEPPRMRSRVAPEAVQADGTESHLHPELVPTALRAITCPVTLLRATRNLQNAQPPIYPDKVVRNWQEVLPQLIDHVVDDTNHYSLMLSERGAKTIAASASDPEGRPSR